MLLSDGRLLGDDVLSMISIDAFCSPDLLQLRVFTVLSSRVLCFQDFAVISGAIFPLKHVAIVVTVCCEAMACSKCFASVCPRGWCTRVIPCCFVSMEFSTDDVRLVRVVNVLSWNDDSMLLSDSTLS